MLVVLVEVEDVDVGLQQLPAATLLSLLGCFNYIFSQEERERERETGVVPSVRNGKETQPTNKACSGYQSSCI